MAKQEVVSAWLDEQLVAGPLTKEELEKPFAEQFRRRAPAGSSFYQEWAASPKPRPTCDATSTD
jgi:hypothetical protein